MTPKQVSTVNLESGSNILLYYNQGHPDAIFKYKQICNVLLSFETWSEKSKNEFFLQFFDCPEKFTYPTQQLVERLCMVSWSALPAAILPRFVKLLQDIACIHVYHTKNIMEQLFNILLPSSDPTIAEVKENANPGEGDDLEAMEPAMSVQKQNLLTKFAREGIVNIVQRLESSENAAVSLAQKKFPHFSGPAFKFTEYIKQLILVAEACPDIAQRLWGCIVENILKIDAYISKSITDGAKFVAGDSVFALDEDNVPSANQQKRLDLTDKLDKAMVIILSRIAHGKKDISNKLSEENLSWLDQLGPESESCVFEQLWPAFTHHILHSHDVQSVSFIWFYACSLDDKYASFMLNMLWKQICAPVFSPNEWKTAQTAAAFFGGFLARADYIPFKTCSRWLITIAEWCNDYIKETSISKNAAGCVQHGTFYAVVQTLLFVFCFRYKEFVERNHVRNFENWGLGKIVHCHLNPLRFISRVVAMGFITISRRLQLIYICNVLDHSMVRESPIEHYLPFSFLQLPNTSKLLTEHLRKFEPTEEDTTEIDVDLMDVDPRKNAELDEGNYDFMDEEMVTDGNPAMTLASVLSSSPFSTFKARAH